MKSSLVFLIFGIFLVLKNVEAEKCLPIPSFFIKTMLQCFGTFNEVDQELYLKEIESDKREFKCFHLCLLEKAGFFKDGVFNAEHMNEITRKYMPTKELAEAVIERDEDTMLRAMKKRGDDCDIAHEYFKIKEEKEKKDPLVTKIFCSDEEEDEEKKDEVERGE